MVKETTTFNFELHSFAVQEKGNLCSFRSLALRETFLEFSRCLSFQIVDPLQVYDNINLGRRIDPQWPNEKWRARGGRSDWKDWLPQENMEGKVSWR